MPRTLFPVKCPRCGEAQNTMPGNTPHGFDPDVEPFGPVACVVCGRQFSRDEYLSGLKAADPTQRPSGTVVPFPGQR